jgi:hypothetical protein
MARRLETASRGDATANGPLSQDERLARLQRAFWAADAASWRKLATESRAEYRAEKSGIVQAPVGRRSFEPAHLLENIRALMDSIHKAKPATSKGQYLRSVTISSTIGPGVKLDLAQFGSR